MTMDCLDAFPPNTPVIALPGWRAPRIVLSKSGSAGHRWRDSAFYPADRRSARLYRLLMRGKAALGLGKVRRTAADKWCWRDFVGDCLPPVAATAVQLSGLSMTQKVTVEFRDAEGRVTGYLKYATQPHVCARLAQESRILAHLPPGRGPASLKFGRLGAGAALLVSPVHGRRVRPTLPPDPGIVAFIGLLAVSPALDLASHPAVPPIRAYAGRSLDDALGDLSGRRWHVGLQHGDFAPWNLRQRARDGSICAFDWEYGRLDGFPYLDLAQFVLQVAALMYFWAPERSAAYAARWLERQRSLDLACREARALTRIAAMEAHWRARDNGLDDYHPLQRWRRTIWSGSW